MHSKTKAHSTPTPETLKIKLTIKTVKIMYIKIGILVLAGVVLLQACNEDSTTTTSTTDSVNVSTSENNAAKTTALTPKEP